jgi:hypothetical protein
MEYPLGKKLDRYLAFYYSQLSYDTRAGRESALEMLKMVVNTFPIVSIFLLLKNVSTYVCVQFKLIKLIYFHRK